MKKSATLADIEGEWTIVKINGQPIPNPSGAQLPFIGFDTDSGRIYGNSGCNRIIASLDLQATPGSIRLEHMGSTLMACPDMETENNIVLALGSVKTFGRLDNRRIALYSAGGAEVLVLQQAPSGRR